MLKKKDNLTDVIEKLPKVEVVEDPKLPKEQQVVDAEGELITLANKGKKNKNLSTYGKSFELKRIIKEAMEPELEKMEAKIIAAVEKELKKRGLLE